MIDFAIVGTSWITESFIASAHATGAWRLAGVFSRTADTASSFAQKNKLSSSDAPIETYTSIEALATDKSIRAVYIASPNSLHHSHAKPLLAAGKHVILEKPATSTSAELTDLFETASKHGVFLLEAFRHLHEPNFHLVKESLSRLGPIYGASLSYCQYSSRYTAVLDAKDDEAARQSSNIFNLDFSAGSLADLGVYPVSAAIALFGPPKSHTYRPYMIRTGADGGGEALFTYTGDGGNDFTVRVAASKIYHSEAPCEVYGEKGTLIFNAIADITDVVFRDAKTKEKTQLAKTELLKLNLVDEAKEFARIIEDRDEKAVGAWKKVSVDTLKVTEEMRREAGVVFKVERK